MSHHLEFWLHARKEALNVSCELRIDPIIDCDLMDACVTHLVLTSEHGDERGTLCVCGQACLCVSVTSLPSGMPLPNAQVRPMTFATKVLKVRYSLSTTPLRMVFISGIPEPAGGGQTERNLFRAPSLTAQTYNIESPLSWTWRSSIGCFFAAFSTWKTGVPPSTGLNLYSPVSRPSQSSKASNSRSLAANNLKPLYLSITYSTVPHSDSVRVEQEGVSVWWKKTQERSRLFSLFDLNWQPNLPLRTWLQAAGGNALGFRQTSRRIPALMCPRKPPCVSYCGVRLQLLPDGNCSDQSGLLLFYYLFFYGKKETMKELKNLALCRVQGQMSTEEAANVYIIYRNRIE